MAKILTETELKRFEELVKEHEGTAPMRDAVHVFNENCIRAGQLAQEPSGDTITFTAEEAGLDALLDWSRRFECNPHGLYRLRVIQAIASGLWGVDLWPIFDDEAQNLEENF